MKRLAALLLAMAMTLAFAGCTDGKQNSEPISQSTESSESSEFVEAIPYDNDSAEAVLSDIMKDYPEDKAFPMGGGDVENMVENAPGKVSLENPEILDNLLSIPAFAAERIDSAASLVHMMNANMFTAGAFHLKDASTSKEFIEEVKANISTKQWLCGSPEKLIIANVGDYVVVSYGAEEIMDVFKAQLTKNIASAEIAVDEAIGQ